MENGHRGSRNDTSGWHLKETRAAKLGLRLRRLIFPFFPRHACNPTPERGINQVQNLAAFGASSAVFSVLFYGCMSPCNTGASGWASGRPAWRTNPMRRPSPRYTPFRFFARAGENGGLKALVRMIRIDNAEEYRTRWRETRYRNRIGFFESRRRPCVEGVPSFFPRRPPARRAGRGLGRARLPSPPPSLDLTLW